MREMILKKALPLLLCAVLLVGAVPLHTHAEGAVGLTEEQRQSVTGRQMDPWYFPLPEECFDDILDYAGCRGYSENALYHVTNEGGFISWYEFACEIFRQAGMPVQVIPVTTEEYGLSKAKRPKNSRLDKSKLVEAGFEPLPTWQDALKRYIDAIKDNNR